MNDNVTGMKMGSPREAKPSKSRSSPKRAQKQDAESDAEAGMNIKSDLSAEDLHKLQLFHFNEFHRLGKLDDIGMAIKYGTRAVNMTPNGHPDLPGRCADLGKSYSRRFQRLGELNDLEESIKHKSRALALTPQDHPDLPDRNVSLGVSYSDRFQRLGKLEDLDKAIELDSCAVASTPKDHPHFPYRLANLGADFGYRFRRFGELDDLEKAIEHGSRVLELLPEGDPEIPRRHTSLGLYYSDRFQRLGALDDLEKAIECHSRALALTPEGHPGSAGYYDNLGVCYSDRFGLLGELEDLERSIEHKLHALSLTPEDDPAYAGRHASLGASYSSRFRRLGVLDSVEKSIESYSRALGLTPEDDPNLSERLANLGICYRDRFHCLNESGDIETAINHQVRALALTPRGHPNQLHRHTVLGDSYHDRFRCLGKLKDIKKAIEHESCALKLTPDGHPDISMRYHALALSRFAYYQSAHNQSQLKKSMDSFRSASQSFTGAIRHRFLHALDWARLARHSSCNCIEAYQTAIDLLPQFIWLGATANQRYHDLSTTEGLAVNAASAAIQSSDDNLALEWLEQARCVVWNQTLMLRSPLDQLHSSHSDLAVRLETVAKELHEASSGSNVSPEQVGKQRRRLAKEYNGLITKARTLSGFENFLRPVKSNQLVRAARYGPIIILNCHTDRSDAIVVLPGVDSVYSIPLPGFSHQKALWARSEIQNSLGHSGLRARAIVLKRKPLHRQKDNFGAVLKLLWNAIVKPILENLGYTDNVPTCNLPHITWCPTGAASFLPLHAAGDYDQPHSRAFNYVISSYTPTLTTLLSSSSASLKPGSRVLAIGQESTSLPGYNLSTLPGTVKELRDLKKHTHNMEDVGYSALVDSKATKSAVLDAMEQHDWVHLACHAHQNVSDPTESGFMLHDGVLDLASINRRSFKNKGLAFLSACQTAMGDEKLADEAVHLASGMLMAGYPSVIATMWSVSDSDAPMVADKVYGRLMEDGKIGNGEAGKALHYAVGALRDEIGEKEFGRWVPYIHIGS